MFRELFITDTSGYASERLRLRLIRRKAGQVELFFAETPNGLGADGLSLNLVRSKVTFSSQKFIMLHTTV